MSETPRALATMPDRWRSGIDASDLDRSRHRKGNRMTVPETMGAYVIEDIDKGRYRKGNRMTVPEQTMGAYVIRFMGQVDSNYCSRCNKKSDALLITCDHDHDMMHQRWICEHCMIESMRTFTGANSSLAARVLFQQPIVKSQQEMDRAVEAIRARSVRDPYAFYLPRRR